MVTQNQDLLGPGAHPEDSNAVDFMLSTNAWNYEQYFSLYSYLSFYRDGTEHPSQIKFFSYLSHDACDTKTSHAVNVS